MAGIRPPVAAPRGELGYAENTAGDTTTETSDFSAAGAKVDGLAVTCIGAGRPVMVTWYGASLRHTGTAGANVFYALIKDGAQAVSSALISPSTTVGQTHTRSARFVLTAGTSYTFEVGMRSNSAGTVTLVSDTATLKSWISVDEK